MRTTAYRRHKTYRIAKRRRDLIYAHGYNPKNLELGRLDKSMDIHRYLYICDCSWCLVGRLAKHKRQPQLYDHDYDNYEETLTNEKLWHYKEYDLYVYNHLPFWLSYAEYGKDNVYKWLTIEMSGGNWYDQ